MYQNIVKIYGKYNQIICNHMKQNLTEVYMYMNSFDW